MIWVRLIGGVAKNKVAKVDSDQVEHFADERLPLGGAFNSFGLAPAASEVKRTRYTRREVRTRDGVIVYFADADLSDFAALQSVLGP